MVVKPCVDSVTRLCLCCAMNLKLLRLKTPIYNITRYSGYLSGPRVTKMSFNVRNVPEEKVMAMTLLFNYKDSGHLRQYNLNRSKSEPLENTLTRLKTSIISKVTKKKKRKSPGEDCPSGEGEDLAIKLTLNNEEILGSVVNEEAFVQGTVLHIDDVAIDVEINLPVVKSIKLPKNIMAGFTIFPKIEAEFTDLSQSSYTWYRFPSKGAKIEDYEEICRDMIYHSTTSDLEYFLKLSCIPKQNERIGTEYVANSPNQVEAGPGFCPFEKRHLYTNQNSEKNCFRFVTYNILADFYSDSDFSRETLFSHCPPYALEMHYRKHLILTELQGYNADVICLQEVDKKVYYEDLMEQLERLGFQGALKLKAGQIKEGEAIFFRKSKFRLVEEQNINLSEVLMQDPLYSDILEKVQKNETFFENVKSKHTVLQVVILESVEDPRKKLCVGNTHFYFHAQGGNIRLIQCLICIRHLENILQQYKTKGEELSVIFTGDLNSTPERGVDKYVTTGVVGADTPEWSENEDVKLEGMEFKHSLKMKSACGYPEYSNYVGYFSGLLDYIYIDTDTIQVNFVVPNPDHEDILLHTALPNVVFPSDHIAQICDLEWKNIGNT